MLDGIMKIHFSKKIIIAFCLATLSLFALGIFSFINTQRLIETARLLSHAMRVMNKGEEVLKSTIDAETAIRGYIITSDSNYLSPYLQSTKVIPVLLNELDSMIAGYPDQIKYLTELKALINLKLTISKNSITARNKTFEAAIVSVKRGDGKKIMDSIRGIIKVIQNNERTFFQAKNKISAGDLIKFQFSIVGLAIAVLVIIGLLFYTINAQINRQKKSAEQIAFLARLVENTSEAVYSVTNDFNIRTWNRGAEKLYGYSSIEAIGKPVLEIIRSNMKEPERFDIRKKILDTGQWEDELEHIRKDGSVIYIIASVTASRNEQNEIEGYVTVARDITYRKNAELKLNQFNAELEERIKERTAELQKSNERLQAILENEPECVKLLGSNGELIEINPSGLAMIEADDAEQVLGRSMLPCVSEKYRDSFQQLTDNVFKGYSGRLEFESIGFKGTHRWLETHAVPLKDEKGTVISLLGVTRDVTERKRADEEIKRLNRNLEKKVKERTQQWQAANKELEAFSYSVSHDLRAPLRSIEGYARILVEDYAESLGEGGRKIIETITRNTERMSKLIDDMLSFSRFGRIEMTYSAIDMNELVQNVLIDLIAHENGRIIKTHISNLHNCRGDASMINQVLHNYIANALKYSSKKIETIISIDSIQDDKEICYSIKDNGAGFDNQYTSKLFAVFQRLHNQNEFEGTGVGLATCKRIIERHGGRVWGEGEKDRGATFFFSIPVLET